MKKLLLLVAVASILIQPCFASVKQEIKSIDVKSENLSKQYDGYEVTFYFVVPVLFQELAIHLL